MEQLPIVAKIKKGKDNSDEDDSQSENSDEDQVKTASKSQKVMG